MENFTLIVRIGQLAASANDNIQLQTFVEVNMSFY